MVSNSISNRILIIDDDVNVTESLTRYLQRDFKVISANSTKVASQLLLERDFPIIILDYELGENIDGVIFSKHITSMHPRTYIIMLTGHKDFDLVKRAINEGTINYILHKPVDSTKLMDIIGQAFEKYQNNAQLFSYLKNPDGIAKAKAVLSDVISTKIVKPNQLDDYQISGIVISKGSLPVYSKFYDEEIFQSFSDTLFAGFMSALVMVGDEIFSMSQGVDSLRFNKISIYFKFFAEYQLSFIIFTPSEVNETHVHSAINSFSSQLQDELVADPLFFVDQTKNFPVLEELLRNLKNSL
jgi:DNA-binding response OmpR family regulator